MVEKMKELFVERFRPKKFEEMVGQKDVVEEVRKGLESGELPHMLFYGPAGVGKTTLALIVARELFGENWRSNWLEINASDENGIDNIRSKVIGFAKVKPLNADFKIIFLDECDYLTTNAQSVLRRVMELYSKNTRFILSCNYVNKVISPIRSRCKEYKFGCLGEGEIRDYLARILVSTGQDKGIYENVIKGIGKECKGDLRSALNRLQGVVGLGLKERKVGLAEGDRIMEFLEYVMRKDFLQARVTINMMLKEGKESRRLLVEIREKVMELGANGNVLLELLKADERLVLGVEEVLVWDGFVLGIINK